MLLTILYTVRVNVCVYIWILAVFETLSSVIIGHLNAENIRWMELLPLFGCFVLFYFISVEIKVRARYTYSHRQQHSNFFSSRKETDYYSATYITHINTFMFVICRYFLYWYPSHFISHFILATVRISTSVYMASLFHVLIFYFVMLWYCCCCNTIW